ncbi:T9SS type A sorting domain-containing protein [Lewinella sp. JB7]|uniref:T9SS type A sorting domain-containing protein n=1 Tax=Lewinella sp. JB7 TaxID=2962887 RepID=UPI0020C95143|nr:T9SS type A sorting domain-containing protein [Lewinella sp. JB7]MCP9235498.1 T9SS type A sorting domain-containing protein [Lewinella sp. JB7]
MMQLYPTTARRSLALLFILSLILTFPRLTVAQTNGNPTLPFAVYLEAECATIGDNWSVETDAEASGESYVVIKPGFRMLDEAPADVPENRVRFTLNVQQDETYYLWGRVQSPSAAEDSYWVRINDGAWIKWFNRLRLRNEWTWREVVGSPFFIPKGEVTIDFAYREPNTKLDKLYLSTLRQSPNGTEASALNCEDDVDCEANPAACESEAWIEAECGKLGNDWEYLIDTKTSNSGYVTAKTPSMLNAPTEQGTADQIVYTTDLTLAGDYYLYMRLNTPDLGKNSFWVKVDDGDWINFSFEVGGADLKTEGFEWRQVNAAGVASSFNLSSGTHTIRVAKREFGTQFDKVFLGRSTDVPTGFGKFSLNCQTNVTTPTRPALDLTANLDVFPNPANGMVNFRLDAPVRGDVTVNLVDLTGRSIRTMNYAKVSDRLADRVDVADLPKGFYRLVITTAEGVVSRPFIRQ